LESRTPIQNQKLRIKIESLQFSDDHFEFCEARKQRNKKAAKQQTESSSLFRKLMLKLGKFQVCDNALSFWKAQSQFKFKN
jgi:hypothetical protein